MTDKILSTPDSGVATKLTENARILKILSYVLLGVAGIFVIFIVILFRKIKLATDIFKCAIEFVKDTPHIFVLPLVFSIMLSLFWSYWLVIMIFCFSYGDLRGNIFLYIKYFTIKNIYYFRYFLSINLFF